MKPKPFQRKRVHKQKWINILLILFCYNPDLRLSQTLVSRMLPGAIPATLFPFLFAPSIHLNSLDGLPLKRI